MKLTLAICFLLFQWYTSSAQYIVTLKNEDGFLKNADGSLIQKKTSFTEEGSGSLPKDNCAVKLKTPDGKVYKDVNGRIDLETEKFIFTVKEQDFICLLPFVEIQFDSCDPSLQGAVFKKGFPAVDKQNDNSLYQVLSKGKATLLKHYAVTWQDLTPFNTTNTTRVYKQAEQHYLYLDGKMFRLEKNRDNLLDLLHLSKDYVAKNNLSLKKESDVAKIVDFYNSL